MTIKMTELDSYQSLTDLRTRLDDARHRAADAHARAAQAQSDAAQRAAEGEDVDADALANLDAQVQVAEREVETLSQAVRLAEQRCVAERDQLQAEHRAEAQRAFREAHQELADSIDLATAAMQHLTEARTVLTEVDDRHAWAGDRGGLPWAALNQARQALEKWPSKLPEPAAPKPQQDDERVLLHFQATWGSYSRGSVAGFPPAQANKLLAMTTDVFDTRGNAHRIRLCERMERDPLSGELQPAASSG